MDRRWYVGGSPESGTEIYYEKIFKGYQEGFGKVTEADDFQTVKDFIDNQGIQNGWITADNIRTWEKKDGNWTPLFDYMKK